MGWIWGSCLVKTHRNRQAEQRHQFDVIMVHHHNAALRKILEQRPVRRRYGLIGRFLLLEKTGDYYAICNVKHVATSQKAQGPTVAAIH
jgi:S-adenosylmethionine:diacylglycerol 3-amino-3-carboxypropyl transferase